VGAQMCENAVNRVGPGSRRVFSGRCPFHLLCALKTPLGTRSATWLCTMSRDGDATATVTVLGHDPKKGRARIKKQRSQR